jgi:ATP-dependent Clp protease adaptor protein ClpS
MTSPGNLPAIREQAGEETALAPRFHLVLLDDNDHSYDYVIELLGHVFGYAPPKAFALARIVDTEGRVIVETAGYEQVAGHQRQIHSYGADPRIPRCQGSMSALIEPAK